MMIYLGEVTAIELVILLIFLHNKMKVQCNEVQRGSKLYFAYMYLGNT